MAAFPYMPMVAIMASLVSSLVVQMSAFSYVGYMVQYLGVVDDKNKAGETRLPHTWWKLCEHPTLFGPGSAGLFLAGERMQGVIRMVLFTVE